MDDLMSRPPRDEKESLFAHGGLRCTVFYGLLIGGVSLAAFLMAPFAALSESGREATWAALTESLGNPMILSRAQTYAFTVLGLSQLFHAVGMRNMRKSVFAMDHLSNKLMIAAFFARPLPYTNDKAAGVVIAMAPGLICVIFAVLLYGNLYAERAYRMVQVGLRELTPTTMTELAAIDKYNWSQYELDMAVNAAQSPIREYAATAAEYARHCRTLRIYTINHSLERYVYLPMERYDEFFEASREGIPQAASREAVWQYEFELYEAAVQGLSGSALERLDWFAGQIRRTYDMLVEYNQGRLERITLTGPNLRFLDRILTVEASGLSGQEAVELMNRTLFHSGSAADTDSDGVPDSLGVAGGALTPTGGGWSLSAGAAVTLSLSGYGVEEAVLTVGCSDPAALTVQVDGTPVEAAAEGGVLTAALPAAGELSITAQEEVVLSSVELTVPS